MNFLKKLTVCLILIFTATATPIKAMEELPEKDPSELQAEEPDICPVCREELLQEDLVILPCSKINNTKINHFFCKGCIDSIHNMNGADHIRCPLCNSLHSTKPTSFIKKFFKHASHSLQQIELATLATATTSYALSCFLLKSAVMQNTSTIKEKLPYIDVFITCGSIYIARKCVKIVDMIRNRNNN